MIEILVLLKNKICWFQSSNSKSSRVSLNYHAQEATQVGHVYTCSTSGITTARKKGYLTERENRNMGLKSTCSQEKGSFCTSSLQSSLELFLEKKKQKQKLFQPGMKFWG